MPPLAELQSQFAAAVMAGTAPAGLFIGRVPAEAALQVHRGTVVGALTHALRLSCPTVEALVGADFFDHACAVFVPEHLPQVACLSDYGEGFADFLAAFAPTLPYLPDVARLDRAIETALRAPDRARRFTLDQSAAIALPESLAVLALQYPADEIRAALQSNGGDDDALAAIAMRPAERFVLVWRRQDEAAVQPISAASGRFLKALLAGDGVAAALEVAGSDALAALQADIFAASFCTVIPLQETTP